jgi:acetyl esterase/lipase
MMSLNTAAFFVAFFCVASAAAAEPQEIALWPNGMPQPVVPADPPETVERSNGISRRSNVSNPRLFVYQPPEGVSKSGTAVIVVPGGGLSRLADEHEGSEACVWLAKQGVVAFQLAHRVPTNMHPEPYAGPSQDVQRAVSVVRSRAAESGIKADKIGVLGFSAGGHATLIAASNELLYPDEKGQASHRPDFLVLLYPYKIYDPATKSLQSKIRLDGGLPPTFIAQMGDDTGSVPQGSALLYLELVNRKIPAEIHIYERGGHGFGMRSRPNATGPTDWQGRALDWLRLRGLVRPAESQGDSK